MIVESAIPAVDSPCEAQVIPVDAGGMPVANIDTANTSRFAAAAQATARQVGARQSLLIPSGLVHPRWLALIPTTQPDSTRPRLSAVLRGLADLRDELVAHDVGSASIPMDALTPGAISPDLVRAAISALYADSLIEVWIHAHAVARTRRAVRQPI